MPTKPSAIITIFNGQYDHIPYLEFESVSSGADFPAIHLCFRHCRMRHSFFLLCVAVVCVTVTYIAVV